MRDVGGDGGADGLADSCVGQDGQSLSFGSGDPGAESGAAQRLLQEGLRLAKLRPSQLSSLKKGDPRKAKIAATLHAQTTVPLAWIAQALHMGTPSNVSQACKRCVKP